MLLPLHKKIFHRDFHWGMDEKVVIKPKEKKYIELSRPMEGSSHKAVMISYIYNVRQVFSH